MNKRILLSTTCLMVSVMTMNAFGGQWIQEERGWRYDQGNGAAIQGQWKWIDGNADGVEECYYFDAEGYCLISTVTPDGYQVNHNGAWIEGQVVRQRTAAAMLTEAESQIAVDLGAYTVYLPNSWEGYYQVEKGTTTNSILYSPVKTYPETLFYITSYQNKATVDEVMFYMDGFQYLGEHGGLYYAAGYPTDTALEFYSNEDREQVSRMRKDFLSIVGNIKFK